MLPVANGELIAALDPGRAARSARGRRAHVLVEQPERRELVRARRASDALGAASGERS